MPYRDDWYEFEQLHRAAQDGNVEDMARLVGEGFDVNAFDDMSRTPLHYAVENNHYPAAQWLLANGADVNANEEEKIGETPLSPAAESGSPEMVELLLKSGGNPDISGWMGLTARYRAQQRKDEEGSKVNALLNQYRPVV